MVAAAVSTAPPRSFQEAICAAFDEDDRLRATLSPEEYQAAMDEADAAAWDELPTLELWFWLREVCPNYSRESLEQAVRAAQEEASPGERDLIAVVQRIARRQLAREAREATSPPSPPVLYLVPAEPAARPRQPRRVRPSASASAASDDGDPDPMPRAWLTTAEVAERVAVSVSTIERLKARAEARGIAHPPWTYLGRSLRWRASRVDDFIEEATKWHSSKHAGRASTSSVGATSTENSGGGPAPRSPRRANSSSKSRPPAPSEKSGSLKALAKLLTSKR